MKLIVYKGFDVEFLSKLSILPLVDSAISEKKNVLTFDTKVHRKLDRALLSMDDDETRWITYEEYSLIKDHVELSVKDYGLDVVIYTNNLFPDYYLLGFELSDELVLEIQNNLGHEITKEQSIECQNFLKVFN